MEGDEGLVPEAIVREQQAGAEVQMITFGLSSPSFCKDSLMSQEDYPVEFVLDSIEAVMAPSKQPKVL